MSMTPKQIKKTRLELGYTQEDFAAQVGVRATTIYRWETGRAKPHNVFIDRIQELAKNGERGAA
jgi:DNA-binding XRE family transcriptional regulator